MTSQEEKDKTVAPTTEDQGVMARYGLILATIALIAIVSLPHPSGLPVAGQNMLGILVFSVII